MQEVTVQYGRHDIQGVFLDGQFWVKGVPLGNILGITEGSVRTLFHKHRREFGPEETRVVKLPTLNGEQDVRVFSETGAAAIALLSRKPEGVPFRRWLMKRALRRETPSLPDGKPARAGKILSLKEAKLLDFLGTYAEPGSKIETVIKGVRDGSVVPETDLAVLHLATKYRDAGAKMAEARRAYSEIDREARELGYEPEDVKRAARVAQLHEAFPQLPFEEATGG